MKLLMTKIVPVFPIDFFIYFILVPLLEAYLVIYLQILLDGKAHYYFLLYCV